MKPILAAALIQVGLVCTLSAAAQSLGPEVSGAACRAAVLDDFELPRADDPSHESARRELLSEIDLAYADLLAAEFVSRTSKRTAEVECELDRYRARARELEPVRLATKGAYERADSELESEERIAPSLCLPYEFGSRDWKRCEQAAAARRAKLRSRLRVAKRAWNQVDNPPDYTTDDGSTYWITKSEARERINAVGQADRSVEPRHVGPEVWCGPSNLRRADTLLAPESEFMRVTEGINAAARNLMNYQERYAQAFDIERESLQRADRPIRARVLRSQVEKLDEIRIALEGWRCQATWNEARARELSDVPDAAALAYLDAKDDLDRLETQCDVHRPADTRWGTQARAWIECLKSVESERDDKLHALERKKTLHEATLEAAFRVGSRE